MAKANSVGVRLEPEERVALQQAASAADRTLSALARRVLVDWLRKNGHLAEAKA